MKEKWKPVKGYENWYEVSNLGRVRSLDRQIKYRSIHRTGKLIKLGCTRGYYYAKLHKNNKRRYVGVHRLVADAFIPNPNNLPEVNHKDENKQNNCANNLEWCTRKYNVNYGTGKQRRASTAMIPVVQTDMDGNIIQTFSSALEASRKLCC